MTSRSRNSNPELGFDTVNPNLEDTRSITRSWPKKDRLTLVNLEINNQKRKPPNFRNPKIWKNSIDLQLMPKTINSTDNRLNTTKI